MSALLVLTLAVPLVGSVLAAVRSPRLPGSVAPATAGAAAAGWAVIASASPDPEIGRLAATPLVAVAAVGLAVLAAARPAASALGRSTQLTGVTVFPAAAAASAGTDDGSDVVLAAGLVVLVLLTALAARNARPGWRAYIGTTAAGLAAAGGLLVDDAERGAILGLVGVGLAIVTSLLVPRAGTVATLPAFLLVAAQLTDAAAPVTEPDPAAFVASAVVFAVAGATLLRWRRSEIATSDAPALAVVAAALVVVTLDLPDARGAGLLLGAGGVLALAARHPVGLIAVLPGLTVALESFGAASQGVHAVAAAAAVVVLLAGALAAGRGLPPSLGRDDWPVLAAVAFGVLPAWGWSGVALPDHAVAVATAAAFALPVMLLAVLGRSRATASARVVPTEPTGVTGRLTRRRRRAAPPSHGSTIADLEREGPEDDAEAKPGEEDGEDVVVGPAAQHRLATPSRAVPLRAPADGVRGRGRLRARPGRAP